MIPLKEILEEMAGQMNGVMVLSVVGVDGFTIAEYNPAGVNTDAVSALFALFMNSVEKSVNELENLGTFEENLVLIQTDKSWILTRLLTGNFFLNIVVSREETLQNIRLLARKYSGRLERALKPA